MDEYSYGLFSPGIDWGSIINRGIDVVGAAVSKSPYYSPNDPRYQPQPQPPVYYPTSAGAGGAVRTSVSSDGAGLHLSKETLMMIAGGVLIFMLASRRR